MSEPTGPSTPRAAKGSSKAKPEPTPPGAADPTAADPTAPAPEPAAPAQGAAAAGEPTSAIPSPTQPMPTAGPIPGSTEAVPAVSAAAPATPPSGPPPVGPPAPATGGPGGPPPRRPGLWRQATSTTGGLIAVIVACALTAFLVLGVIGTLGLVAVRAASHDDHPRMERVREDRQGLPPGQQRKLDRQQQGPGQRGNGNDKGVPDRPGPGNGLGNGPGNGLGNGPGNGMGQLMRGAMGLGDVQHGEFTVQQDGKAVVMILQRGSVTKASATSVTVKSDDNFSGTYAIDDQTRGRTGALAVGDSVVVVAEKTGAKAVIITATRKG